MGVRTIDRQSTEYVIPLRGNEIVEPASEVDEPLPGPARLYGLIVLAFLLHTPHPVFGGCEGCGRHWPCPQLRLAYRLREGFSS